MRVQGRQSFAQWRLPRALDGLVLAEDWLETGHRYRAQERHSHDELELHLIVRGHAAFVLPDRKLHAGAGTLLWIPPGCEHVLLDTSPDLRRWLLLVRRRVVVSVLPRQARARALDAVQAVKLSAKALHTLEALLEAHPPLRASADSEQSAIGLVNASVAYALARAFLDSIHAPAAPSVEAFHPAVVRALATLRSQSPPPSLPELSRVTQVSAAHLSKLFSAQVGVSLTEFRNALRLERFVQRYAEGTETTLLSAALDAGFGSYAQFHRVYKQRMGHAPGRRPR